MYTRQFQIRHYECDMYGHLNNVQYLHYMEQAAFEASTALGYDLAHIKSLGLIWLTRQSEIEYLAPVRYGQPVAVRTWVATVRGARSQRAYEFWQGDKRAARAYTEWVLVDGRSRRPVRVPTDLASGYLAGEDSPPAVLGRGLKSLPPAPPEAFRTRRRVEWRDIDPLGHVNNAVYLAYAEDCGVQVAAAFGWPLERWHQEGFAAVARRHRVLYREAARLDDELELATWLSNVRRATIVRDYAVRRAADGKELTRVRTLWAWVDLENGRPIRIPPDFVASFEANIFADDERPE